MMEPRCYHAVSLMDSFVFVTGGHSPLQRRDGEMLAVSSTDRLDIRTTLWKRCSDMKEARAYHAMATVGKHLFVFGGRNAFGNSSGISGEFRKKFFVNRRLPEYALFIGYTHSLNNARSIAFSQRSSSTRLIEDEIFNDSDIINNLIDYEDGHEELDSLRAATIYAGIQLTNKSEKHFL
ncbi:beta-scruin [Trichonephila clavipes]|nr:beta-scruin [Trichonephila clavipes]